MSGHIKLTSSIMTLILLAGTDPYFAATYEPEPIETMIKKSDLIVIGTVDSTSVYAGEKGDAIRRMTIRIQETIKPGATDIGETIVVEHLEGLPGPNEGEIQQFAYFRPIFAPAQQVLLLLLSKGDTYEVTGSFRGKLDIIQEMVAGTSTALADFKNAIKRVDRKEVSKLEVDMVPIEHQLDAVRPSGERAAGKVASIRGYHLGGQFYASVNNRHYPPLAQHGPQMDYGCHVSKLLDRSS
jgi:hypothetical protein